MNEYRIEKLRRRLSVVLRDGTRLEGDIFLPQVSRFGSRPEEPADLLNDPEPFFALATDGQAVLVAKSNVQLVETRFESDDENLASLGMPVEVTLTDGTLCDGSIFIESPAGRPRLLDFLNSYPARFLPVVDATRVVLVNTQTIAHVREVA